MTVTIRAHCTCSFCLWDYHPVHELDDEYEAHARRDDLVSYWQEVHDLERDGCRWPIAWSLGND